MTDNPIAEVMARAMCPRIDCPFGGCGSCKRILLEDAGRALAALESAGLKVLPVELPEDLGAQLQQLTGHSRLHLETLWKHATTYTPEQSDDD